jgi:hypothetical protein
VATAAMNQPSLVCPVTVAVGAADQHHSRVRAREGGVIWGPRLSRAVAKLFGLRLQCRRMGEKGKGAGAGLGALRKRREGGGPVGWGWVPSGGAGGRGPGGRQ